MQYFSSVVRTLTFVFVSAPVLASEPLFIEQFALTNRYIELKAFNNAGDILISIFDEGRMVTYSEVPAVIRDGKLIDLFPDGLTNISGTYATGISQAREDGGLYIAGTAIMKDGFWRAALWDLAADGTFTYRTMPNIVLPEDSSAPGEQSRGFGNAVNRSGILVGSGNSYLAGVAVIWHPPYTGAQRFIASTTSSYDSLDDTGLAIINGVEYDHGNSRNRYAAGMMYLGGLPMEIPLLADTPATLYPNFATAHSDEWVAGRNHVGDSTRGFAWRIGAPASIALPVPDGIAAEDREYTEVSSINSSGHATGYLNGGSYSQQPILWWLENGQHRPYLLNDHLPGETDYYRVEQKILINDLNQIVFTVRDWNLTRLKVFKPLLDGLVEFNWDSAFATEEDGSIEFRVKLERAFDNTGRVTVQYQTVEETAISPADFTAQNSSVTWNPGESGEKSIRIAVRDNLTLDEIRNFKLVLTGATGAQLGHRLESVGYISDTYQQFNVRNQIFADWNYGCAVLQGQSQVVLKVERTGGTDGAITFTNFQAVAGSAQPGVDFELPQNLRLSWTAGEAGIKTIAIPLLNTEQTLSEPKNFSVSASGKFEGTENETQIYAGVIIVPDAGSAQPAIDSSAIQDFLNGFDLTIAAIQGSIIELEKSLSGLGSDWTAAAEMRCDDGEVRLLAPISLTNKAGFFRIKVKQ